MSSVVISGDTSGSITLQAPAVAGSNTFTLPAATGTVMVSGNMPVFSGYYTGSGQTINSGTDTLINITTKEFDTAGCFNNTGSTVTLNGLSVPAYAFMPNIAGYYQVTAQAQLNTGANTVAADIYRNGNYWKRGTLGVAQDPYVSAIVYLDGSTNYLQFYVYSTGATTTQSTNQAQTFFQAVMVRSA